MVILMNLLTRISSKMQINKPKKSTVRRFFRFIKNARYDIIFAIEAFALFFGAIYYVFGRKKEFSLLVAFSTLIGSLLTLSGIKHIHSNNKSKKYIDIISTDKADKPNCND